MQIIDSVLLGLVVIFSMGFIFLFTKNMKLKQENENFKEILIVKNSIIHHYEASQVVVKKVSDILSESEKVRNAMKVGESKEEIAKKFNISLSKIEFIVKVEALKNAT
jgi:hypothetical protein